VITRTVRPPRAIDLRLTLGVLRRGRFDPCTRLAPGDVWRATRTPDGPVTTHIRAYSGVLSMRAWGPGAGWAVEAFPALVGDHDDDSTFDPQDDVVAELRRRLRGLRLCRTGAPRFGPRLPLNPIAAI
jgi:hypothetical protein